MFLDLHFCLPQLAALGLLYLVFLAHAHNVLNMLFITNHFLAEERGQEGVEDLCVLRINDKMACGGDRNLSN